MLTCDTRIPSALVVISSTQLSQHTFQISAGVTATITIKLWTKPDAVPGSVYLHDLQVVCVGETALLPGLALVCLQANTACKPLAVPYTVNCSVLLC